MSGIKLLISLFIDGSLHFWLTNRVHVCSKGARFCKTKYGINRRHSESHSENTKVFLTSVRVKQYQLNFDNFIIIFRECTLDYM